jgi:hypothetical protein
MVLDADEEKAGEEQADKEQAGEEQAGDGQRGKERNASKKRKKNNDLAESRSSSDSDQARNPSCRLAAVEATEKIRDQKSGSSPNKRSKRRRNGSSEPSDQVGWLIARLGNDDALTSTLDLVNNWPQVADGILHGHGGLESLASWPMTEPHFQGLYDFVDLGRWINTRPIQDHGPEVGRRINNAHFHWFYRAAIYDSGTNGSGSFFRSSDELLLHNGVVPVRKYGQGFVSAAAVRDRLVDIIFSFPRPPRISREQCRENIHRSDQSGKRWAGVIGTLGYKGAFLVPLEVSDNRYVSNLCSSNAMLPTRRSVEITGER